MKNILITQFSAALLISFFSAPALSATVCEKFEGTYEAPNGFVEYLNGELIYTSGRIESSPEMDLVKTEDQKLPREIVFVINASQQENQVSKYSAKCERNKIVITGTRALPERNGVTENFVSTYRLNKEGDLTIETTMKGTNSSGLHQAIYFRTPGKEDSQNTALTAKNSTP